MPMLNQTRRILLVLLPVLLGVVVALGVVVFREAAHAGHGEAWAAAWVLAFVVGLPVTLVVLAIVGAMQEHAKISGVVPVTGEKIPGAGQ